MFLLRLQSSLPNKRRHSGAEGDTITYIYSSGGVGWGENSWSGVWQASMHQIRLDWDKLCSGKLWGGSNMSICVSEAQLMRSCCKTGFTKYSTQIRHSTLSSSVICCHYEITWKCTAIIDYWWLHFQWQESTFLILLLTTLCLWDPAEEYEHVNKERSNTGAGDTTIRYVFLSISLYFWLWHFNDVMLNYFSFISNYESQFTASRNPATRIDISQCPES